MESTLESRLEATGTRDPRPAYRELLRILKERNAAQFDVLRKHYAEEVERALTQEGEDPLMVWLNYGLVLARALAGEGTAIQVDGDGLAAPAEGSLKPGSLTLFLPEGRGERALALAIPSAATPAQAATLDLLVNGKVRLQPTEEADNSAGALI
jgi:hypothetical protein